MSRLNADIEAGLADRQQTNSDEQAFGRMSEGSRDIAGVRCLGLHPVRAGRADDRRAQRSARGHLAGLQVLGG